MFDPWGSLLDPWGDPFEGQVIFGNIFRSKHEKLEDRHLLGSVFERILRVQE